MALLELEPVTSHILTQLYLLLLDLHLLLNTWQNETFSSAVVAKCIADLKVRVCFIRKLIIRII